MTTDCKPIADAAQDFWAAWTEGDAGRLSALWDMDDRECSYLPAEAEQRLLGPEAVGDYFRRTTEGFEELRLRARSIYPRRLNATLGSVFAEVDWAFVRDRNTPPIGGSIRVSAVIRHADGHWRLCHYAEAPLAPIVELREFYQKIAADGHGSMG